MQNDEGLDKCHLRNAHLRQTLVSRDLGWNKRNWWLAYQHREDIPAEPRASLDGEMSVNAS